MRPAEQIRGELDEARAAYLRAARGRNEKSAEVRGELLRRYEALYGEYRRAKGAGGNEAGAA